MQVSQKQKIDKLLGYFFIVVLWPFTRLLGLLLRRDHSLNKEPRRILVIKLMGLGSLVLALEALKALKKRYPNAELVLLSDQNIAAGIAPFAVFDTYWTLNTNHLFATAFRVTGFLRKTWTWSNLWVLDLEVYSKLTTVLSLLTLARNRFGFFLKAVSFRKYLNTHNVPFDQELVLSQNYWTMVTYAQVAKQPFAYPSTPLSGVAGRQSKPYVALNNTCSSLAYERKLPEITFRDLSVWILEHTSFDLVFLGTDDDYDGIERFIEEDVVLSQKRKRIINKAKSVSDFQEYYRFLQQDCACLVSIDSGPLHMAKQLGVPTLSIWGPTDPEHYIEAAALESGWHLTCYQQVPCSPCIHRYEQLPCGGDNICMKDIPLEMITQRLSLLLNRLKLVERQLT